MASDLIPGGLQVGTRAGIVLGPLQVACSQREISKFVPTGSQTMQSDPFIIEQRGQDPLHQ